MEQFQGRAFEEDPVEFSSYAYRIEAIRLLERVISIDQSVDQGQSMEDMETALTNWFLFLPPHKMSVIDGEGNVDEILFQAHMIVNSCLIMVHLPRSNLASTAVDHTQITCAGNTAPRCLSSAHNHAAKAMIAAKNMNNLISTTIENTKHSPFFVCAIALSVVMQLSACSVRACKCLDPHQAKISMAIGALKVMGTVWPLAITVMQQVRATAKHVLAIGVKRSHQNISDDTGTSFNFDFVVNDTIWPSIAGSHPFTFLNDGLY